MVISTVQTACRRWLLTDVMICLSGLAAMRSIAVSGRLLPSARMISANIHNDVSAPHSRYSLMIMQFAQLLDHDLTFTPVNRGFGDSIIDCRSCDSPRTVHPECAPIPIPPNDPWFPHIDRGNGRPMCIPFTRSLPGQLTLGKRRLLRMKGNSCNSKLL